MSFWSFFTAVCLGKGIIKVVYQSLFFIFIFSSRYDELRATLITNIAETPPFRKYIESRFGGPEKIHDFILAYTQYIHNRTHEALSAGKALDPGEPTWKRWLSLSSLFNAFNWSMWIYFLVNFVNYGAQSRQKELDELEMRRLQSKASAKAEAAAEVGLTDHTKEPEDSEGGEGVGRGAEKESVSRKRGTTQAGC